jgi:pimeloyl-ACP methyl ester carboxylesterase
MLHGFMSGGRDLDRFASQLTEYGLRSFALDFRAHGQSDGPKDPAAYRNQAMARDVLALAEHLGLTEYSIFAYGLGCELTARLANLKAPILRAVMCGWGGPPNNQLDLYASDEWVAQAERLADGFAVDDPNEIKDELARKWRDNADKKGLDRFALAARLRSGDSAEPGLDPRAIPFPVLVICGADDTDPHEFAAALPNAKGYVVDGDHSTAGRAPGLPKAAADFLAAN